MATKVPRILLFNFLAGHSPEDLSLGSNTWQIKNYELIAETVYAVFLGHKKTRIVRSGRTIILTVGTGGTKKDILRAPFILWKLVRRKKIKILFSYEQVFQFWFAFLFKFFGKTRLVMLPNTLPDAMYRINKKSLSDFLPIRVERLFRRWSSYFIDTVILPESSGEYKTWLRNDRVFKKKLRIVEKVIEGTPSPFFFSAIEQERNLPKPQNGRFNLLCVSRLRKEKLLEDALQAVASIAKTDKTVLLHIIGEGADENHFVQRVQDLGIEENVIFHGYKALLDIVPFYNLCDIYVSTLTGSALREAALFGMPVVAYKMDWVSGTFNDQVNYIGIEAYDHQALAKAILELKQDPVLSKKLATNIRLLAEDQWSQRNLAEAYDPIIH